MSVDSIISSLRSTVAYDFLRVAGDSKLIKTCNASGNNGIVETVLFSERALKINKRGKEQERDIVATTRAFYNFVPKDYSEHQRCIPIAQISGIVMSTVSDEVVIQVTSEYDYHLRIVRRAEFAETISQQFQKLTGNQLNPTITSEVDLTAHVCTKENLPDKLAREKHAHALSKRSIFQPSNAAAAAAAAFAGPTAAPAVVQRRGGSFTMAAGVSLLDSAPVIPPSRRSTRASVFVSPQRDASGAMTHVMMALLSSVGLMQSVDSTPTIEEDDSKPITMTRVKSVRASVKPQIANDVSHSGWLTKCGNENTTFRRRFAVISNSNLLYYAPSVKGSTRIQSGFVRSWKIQVTQEYQQLIAKSAAETAAYISAQLTTLQKQHAQDHTALLTAWLLNPIVGDANTPNNQSLTNADLFSDESQSLLHSFGFENNNFHRDAFAAFCLNNNLAAHLLYFLDISALKVADLSNNEYFNRLESVCNRYLCDAGRFSVEHNKCDTVAIQQFLSASRTQAAADSSFKAVLPSNLFDSVMQTCVQTIVSVLIPRYFHFFTTLSERNEQLSFAPLAFKTSLTADEKETEQCQSCRSTFSFMRRAHACSYCESIVCHACRTQSCELPAVYYTAPKVLEAAAAGQALAVDESAHQQIPVSAVPVCDMCASVLSDVVDHQLLFAVIASAGERPINLCAESQADLQQWLAALQTAVSSVEPASGALRVHKEGWLLVEDASSRQWHRDYFVLDRDRLWHLEMTLKGSLQLTAASNVHLAQVLATSSEARSVPLESAVKSEEADIKHRRGRSFSTSAASPLVRYPSSENLSVDANTEREFAGLECVSGFSYRFNVAVAKRVYKFAADTDNQSKQWISCIQRVIARLDGSEKSDEASAASSTPSAVYAANLAQDAPSDQVTFVFTDVQSSTNLWESVPDAMNKALEAHDRILRALLQRFRGYEVKTEGDAFMVTFFTPYDALLWCIAVQHALLEHKWPDELGTMSAAAVENTADGRKLFAGIRIRMGVHLGYPNCRRNPVTARMDYFGPVVNRSARVSDSAHGGQIVCTTEVYDAWNALDSVSDAMDTVDRAILQDLKLVDVGKHHYKGIQEEVQVYQVTNSLLRDRSFPPLRTEKAEEAEEEADEASS